MEKFHIKYLLDLYNTFYFNFKVLPFHQAIKLPFYVSHSYHISLPNNAKDIVMLSTSINRFSIRFGNGGSDDIIPNKYGIIHLEQGSKVVFSGTAKFAAGCSLKVLRGGDYAHWK